MAIQPIKIVISGVDKFSAQLAKSMQGIDKMGKQMTNIGRKMSIGLTVPLVAIGFASVQAATKYEESMARMGALTGATSAQMEALRRTTMSLGMTTMHSAGQAAEALQLMADSGFKLDASMVALPSVLNLSTIGMTTLAEAVDIADNLTEGYNKSVTDMAKINDIMAVTAKRGGISVNSIAKALTNMAPVASQLGISMEEMSATIGNMGTMGINMTRGMMSLRTGLTQLLDPSSEAIKTFNKLGIRKADLMDSSGRIISLANTMDVLKAKGASTNDLMNIFGKQAGPVLAKFVQQGGGALRQFQTELTGVTGTADELQKAMENTFGGQMKKLTANVQTLAISLGEALLPILKPLVSGLQKAAGWFMNLPSGIKTSIVVIGGIVAAIGPLLVAISSIFTIMAPMISSIAAAGGVFALLSNPIGWTIAGLIALGAVIAFIATHFQSKIGNILTALFPLMGVVGWIMNRWERLLPFFKLLFLVLGFLFKKFADFIRPVLQPIADFLSWLGELMINVLDGILGGMEKLAGAVLPDWLKQKIGLVPAGAGTEAGGAAALRAGAVNVNNQNVNETKIVIDNKAGAQVRTQTEGGAVDIMQTYSGQAAPALP